ncbi:hypothetical protein MBLNU459_g6780t1 [Dothideomycetes sp. NU459]
MPAASAHPRRRPASPTMTSSLLESFASLSLRKACTFHSPTLNKSDLWDPLVGAAPSSSRSMPPRSSTCPKDLEDLLIGAGERRALQFLARVDQAIERHSSLALGNLLHEPDALPNPAFVLDNTSLDEVTDDKESAHNDGLQNHDHASDSGLGSSISDPEEFTSVKLEDRDSGMMFACDAGADTHTSGTDLHSVPSKLRQATKHCLSEYAGDQIQKHIVKPILREQALKDFHSLVQSVPRRIERQQIATLRDLEKKLIFLAPDYSRSPAAYLQFCETAIHCLHATVDSVHESDQRAPTDRPYTNHYFLDLVEQIRRYASILAATREREAEGENPAKSDVAKDERLELHGGMTHNGRPAELVRRRKSGTLISLNTGEVIPPSPRSDAAMAPKRSMSAEVDDDGVRRSMARRKKGAPIQTYTCNHGACDRQFPRRCDLTKHMKTHERAWKCRKDHTCEYTTKGWPTEKERDRHENDKHNPDAVKYNCEFCDYFSTRPENTKAHQEKKHQWDYVRQKTIKGSKASKTRVKQPVKRAPKAQPSASSTPFSSVEQSPFASTHQSLSVSPQAMITPNSADQISPFDSPMMNVPTEFNPDFGSHFNFDFNDLSMSMPFGNELLAPMQTPSLIGDRRASHGSSTMDTTPAGDTSFEDAMIPPTPEGLNFANSLFNGYNFQQAPDATFLDTSSYNNVNATDSTSSAHAAVSPHFRLGNQEDPTLSVSQVYPLTEQDFCGNGAMDDDFQLYDHMTGSCNDPLFQDQTGFGSLGSQFNDQPSSSSNTESQTFGSYGQYFPELNNGHAQ